LKSYTAPLSSALTALQCYMSHIVGVGVVVARI